jgi:hypothetical protein
MAKKKTNAPRQSTAPLDFEAELWRTSDALRGSMDKTYCDAMIK